MPYTVFVDDNYHYMEESARYRLGVFATCEEAVAACKQIVDGFLWETFKAGMSADALYARYIGFGEDPFIQSDDGNCTFSAWDYARARCQAIVAGQS